MKKLLIGLCSIVQLSAMDYSSETGERVPKPEEKRQILIEDKNTSAEAFANKMKKHPNVMDVKITGHKICHIPDLGIQFKWLSILNLSNGPLSGNAFNDILKMTPVLTNLYLANNQLKDITAANGLYCGKLMQIDCSNNKIESADLAKMQFCFPNLMALNLSGNKTLTKFSTNDLLRSELIPEVDLRGTGLSNTSKKEILKSAQVLDNGGAIFGITGGFCVGVLSWIPLMIANPSTSLLITMLLPVCIGTPLGYPTGLAIHKPADRVKTVFKPLLDNADYPESETRSAYFRFVKNFPYIGNITKCCRAEDPEYQPLSQVEDNN